MLVQPAKKLIIIDLGHGGKDPGAVFKGDAESKIVRAIAAPLIEQLNREGRVDAKSSFSLLNRPEDSDWLDKDAAPELSKYNVNACKTGGQEIYSLFSLHVNWEESQKASGLVVLQHGFLEIAEDFYKSMIDYMRISGHDIRGNRGQAVFNRPDLAILNVQYFKQDSAGKPCLTGLVPSLLLETGFLSNATDRQLLERKPALYAEAIAQGIYTVLKLA